MELELTSSAFEANEMIPALYTCEGTNISPPLSWRETPDEVESIVLICDDPDAPSGTWTHWVIYDIPPIHNKLDEGVPTDNTLSWGATQGRNSFGDIGYGGPCPPHGSTHRYYFRLYALDEKLELPPGANRAQVLDAMEGHIMARSELVGRYARS